MFTKRMEAYTFIHSFNHSYKDALSLSTFFLNDVVNSIMDKIEEEEVVRGPM